MAYQELLLSRLLLVVHALLFWTDPFSCFTRSRFIVSPKKCTFLRRLIQNEMSLIQMKMCPRKWTKKSVQLVQEEQQQGMQMLLEECVWRMSLRKTDVWASENNPMYLQSMNDKNYLSMNDSMYTPFHMYSWLIPYLYCTSLVDQPGQRGECVGNELNIIIHDLLLTMLL